MLIPVKVLNISDQHKTVKVSHSFMVIGTVGASCSPSRGQYNIRDERQSSSLSFLCLQPFLIHCAGFRESWPVGYSKLLPFAP